jgi:hypothetical protein
MPDEGRPSGSSGARSVRRRIGGKSGNRRLATPTHAVPRRGQGEARVRRFKNDARVRHADGPWRAVARGLTECDTRPGAGRAEADISGRALVEGPPTGGSRAHADCVPLGGSRTGASSEHVLADERGCAADDGARRRTSRQTVGWAAQRLDHRSRPHQPNSDSTLLHEAPPGNPLVGIVHRLAPSPPRREHGHSSTNSAAAKGSSHLPTKRPKTCHDLKRNRPRRMPAPRSLRERTWSYRSALSHSWAPDAQLARGLSSDARRLQHATRSHL